MGPTNLESEPYLLDALYFQRYIKTQGTAWLDILVQIQDCIFANSQSKIAQNLDCQLGLRRDIELTGSKTP